MIVIEEKDNDELEEELNNDGEAVITPEMANQSIELVDQLLNEIVFSDVSKRFLSKVRCDNWNKLTKDERIDLYAKYGRYISDVLGQDLVYPGIATTNDLVEGKEVTVMDQRIIIYDEVFDNESLGISLLCNVIRELRKYMVNELVESFFENDDGEFYSKLVGKAKVYYENRAESWLFNSWENFYSREHKNYYYQPLIYDATKLEMDILFGVLKELFNQNPIVDKEMSSLLLQCIEFYGNATNAKQEREKIIKRNRENFKNHPREEKIVNDYLDMACGDLTKLSDDDFYSLFNNSFFGILSSPRFGCCDLIIEGLSNELTDRIFNQFDLTGIELPSYQYHYDAQKGVMEMSILYNGEVTDTNVNDASDAFTNVMHYIAVVAQKHNLFDFNSDKEEKDYMLMKKWLLEKKGNFDDSDEEILKNGLNIVMIKVAEMFNKLEKRVNESIRKSDLLNVGSSILRYYDLEAHIEYNEFLEAHTREEIHECIQEYVSWDLENMKKAGGR